MARIYPADITRLALAGAHSHELVTLRELKEKLPNDFAVFHGVHWTREYRSDTAYGEIDFVVVNQAGEVLVIEQKNGSVDESGAGLVKSYANRDKNIIEQVHRSIDRVRDKFKGQHEGPEQLNIDYLIYLPDYRVKRFSAPGVDESRIVDAASKDGLAARIKKVLGKGDTRRSEHRETVEGFFRQSLDLVPDIHAHKTAQEREFVRLSGGIAELVDNLEMHPFRLRVSATAGSGKSLLAVRFFERMVESGKRPALVCFNRPLCEQLKTTVREGGYVNTLYGFFNEFLKSRGQHLNFDEMRSDPKFWAKVQEKVVAEDIPDEWRFDTLTLDEGQDFDEESIEVLKLFLNDDAALLWLEDPDQNLRRNRPAGKNGYVHYRSNTNYRTPVSIARFIGETLSVECRFMNPLPGLGVDVRGYDNPRAQPILAAKVVDDLMRQGFKHEDIVILTCRGLKSNVFKDIESVHNVPLIKFTGEYDADGNQLFTNGRLRFDSIQRFKGQQAAAVILADVDPDPEKPDRAFSSIFCGMTRATVKLCMLVNEENPASEKFLKA
jgi:hypothetical protein